MSSKKTNDKSAIISNLKVNNQLITEPMCICNTMNNHFVQAGERVSKNAKKSSVDPTSYVNCKNNSNTMSLNEVSVHEIECIIKRLKPKELWP